MKIPRELTGTVPASNFDADTWDPSLQFGPAAGLRRLAPSNTFKLSDLAWEIREGMRDVPNNKDQAARKVGAPGPIYRQANLGAIRWRFTPDLWQQPKWDNPACVQPG